MKPGWESDKGAPFCLEAQVQGEGGTAFPGSEGLGRRSDTGYMGLYSPHVETFRVLASAGISFPTGVILIRLVFGELCPEV